jgi:uncharacterized membrane protein YedE/YeeE
MPVLTALLAGLLFGLGLILSGMSNPARVLGFLDVAGTWNPSLLLVMAGAVAIAAPMLAVAGRRAVSYVGAEMKLPTARQIDGPLVAGGILFGIGWGLAGLCPGPAIVIAGGGETKAIVFVIAMVAGMTLFELRRRNQPHGNLEGHGRESK